MSNEKDLDGLEKNLAKMKEAKKRLKENPRLIEAHERLDDASLFSTGKDNWFHCALNIDTETARAEPYYYVHVVWWYRLGPSLLANLVLLGVVVFG